MKIVADKDRCIGAGQCVMNASAVFSQDEETGLVVVLKATPDPQLRAEVEAAVRACPTCALTLLED